MTHLENALIYVVNVKKEEINKIIIVLNASTGILFQLTQKAIALFKEHKKVIIILIKKQIHIDYVILHVQGVNMVE